MKTQNIWNRFRLSDNQKRNPNNLKLHFEKGIDVALRKQYIDLTKWLRKTFAFPTLLNVYIINTEKMQLGNGKWVFGSFKWFNKRTPIIKIPSSVGEELKQEYTNEEINEMILSSLIHEITHYYQWVEGLKQTNAITERQANFYRYRILNEFFSR